MGRDCMQTTTFVCGCKKIFSYTDGELGWYNCSETHEYCAVHLAQLKALEAQMEKLKRDIAKQACTVTDT